jgi:hypothetical protein
VLLLEGRLRKDFLLLEGKASGKIYEEILRNSMWGNSMWGTPRSRPFWNLPICEESAVA